MITSNLVFWNIYFLKSSIFYTSLGIGLHKFLAFINISYTSSFRKLHAFSACSSKLWFTWVLPRIPHCPQRRKPLLDESLQTHKGSTKKKNRNTTGAVLCSLSELKQCRNQFKGKYLRWRTVTVKQRQCKQPRPDQTGSTVFRIMYSFTLLELVLFFLNSSSTYCVDYNVIT